MPTALIVEDEPEANKLLSMLVQLRGYRTQSAFLGGEAMDQAHDVAPDVVFLDLMLPDVDGYHVCRNLKSSAVNQLTPVVIVTARVATENRIESFGAGADDYVPKPYTPDQIFQALERSRSSKQQPEGPDVNGVVVIDYREKGDTLRSLARLRNFLVSQFGPEATMPIAMAIKSIWLSVDHWTRHAKPDPVTTLSYSLENNRLTLVIVEESGGFLPTLRGRHDSLTKSLTDAQFDHAETSDDFRSLSLVKQFATPPAPDA